MSRGPKPASGVSGAGTAYVSTTAEDQVHAFPRDGNPWALRVDWQRRLTAEVIEQYRTFVEEYPGGAPSSVQDPDVMGFQYVQPEDTLYEVYDLKKRKTIQSPKGALSARNFAFTPDGRYLLMAAWSRPYRSRIITRTRRARQADAAAASRTSHRRHARGTSSVAKAAHRTHGPI